ncbi:GNAT family N-acetyltransferase [Pseudoalteromonas sp. OOF1S-7]|uniref:GNAT family N-acetyltransferase n=1 Tax=Pseudoalteromonas sp. OOF1S-7 TaxID=2917757 RepID=UPI001EF4F4C3|nr:GNAT family N-acetyltransferase [Pseudoalteromonas sp. OOF1S-7]MCG7537709.1 GNAT family N-acetyltransferase [Pseudoalteromonas sp. OOF1S-7]
MLTPVDTHNLSVYLNLAQAYEAEFSVLTDKSPGADGLFALDTLLEGRVTGYLWYENETPVGLAAIAQHQEDEFEVCEFYIVPRYRKAGFGARFAQAIWAQLPGLWTIKQIAGAQYATQFWRRTIASAGIKNMKEDIYQDPFWGTVTRQQLRTDNTVAG